jgi:6,7-dimethyl-8-ribityllumazine synthase
LIGVANLEGDFPGVDRLAPGNVQHGFVDIIRGDTPHFDYVAGEASRALSDVAVRRPIPVGFGLLTVEVLQQAIDRAGGSAGNKGYEAAEAALRTADVFRQIRDHAPS